MSFDCINVYLLIIFLSILYLRSMVSFRDCWEGLSQIMVVFDWELLDSYPRGKRRAGTHTHALSFSFSFFSFYVQQMHTLASLFAHHCPLSFFLVPLSQRSLGVRADIIQSEGPWRKKECHSFLLFNFFFFHRCTSRYLAPENPLSKCSETTGSGQCSKMFSWQPDAGYVVPG